MTQKERLVFAFSGSTYACLSIAAERYFGICYPNMDSCYRKFRFYVVGIALACIFIDTPRFFEVQVWHDEKISLSIVSGSINYKL